MKGNDRHLGGLASLAAVVVLATAPAACGEDRQLGGTGGYARTGGASGRGSGGTATATGGSGTGGGSTATGGTGTGGSGGNGNPGTAGMGGFQVDSAGTCIATPGAGSLGCASSAGEQVAEACRRIGIPFPSPLSVARDGLCGDYRVVDYAFAFGGATCYYDAASGQLVAGRSCTDVPAFCGGRAACIRSDNYSTSLGGCDIPALPRTCSGFGGSGPGGPGGSGMGGTGGGGAGGSG